MKARRIFVEKKEKFQVEAQSLLAELNENLSLSLTQLRLFNVYDLFGFSDELIAQCRYRVFGEIVTDNVTEELSLTNKKFLAVEYIPGQFDQRAASAVDCVHLLAPAAQIQIRSSRLFVFEDTISDETLARIQHYLINPVECRAKELSTLTLNTQADVKPMENLAGFTQLTPEQYPDFCRSHGLAMNADDLHEVVTYFQKQGRDPLETELRILDTYWSDHCRHTTFTTILTDIAIEDSIIKADIEQSLQRLHTIRHELGREDKSLCLMELATIGARYLSATGRLNDLEKSEENNACSIFVDVDVDGATEKWLLQFKNETHNHPTEIEPFGGAATCLGGAIRDPLSGRAYVYQAMRVTGAANICETIAETMHGKLPQRIISKKAAAGYSSYGNQIGLATTHVREIYDEGYKAKRMEIGAVVGAVKADHIRRESPTPGDIILLLGGRTGRDGVGGATGSSKEHTEASLETCGSEVQKGNAPEERKLQRLFRRPEVTQLIKKSNDFGAGGVSVAIGELADGLDIFIDRVPTKYAGLNATELSISESQERMAVVIPADAKTEFENYCHRDNIEITHVANVTDTGRMRIFHGNDLVCNLERTFIDSAGAPHFSSVKIAAINNINPFKSTISGHSLAEKMLTLMHSPNVASQKGLVEMFDATIGRSTVLMPYGGKRQATETQVSVQKLPVDGYTDTASMMAFGYNPDLARWSPYHGAAYAVVEACAKVVAGGGNYRTMRFSYQEYFEKMTHDHTSWGKPFAALLGALKMQLDLELPAIGGKDSMSGTFEHIHVPPTLVAFGITTVNAKHVISPELKKAGNKLYLIKHAPCANFMPNVSQLTKNWNFVRTHILSGNIVSAWAIGFGGVAEAISKMAFGNLLGATLQLSESDLFDLNYGSLLVESPITLDFPDAILVGNVNNVPQITINETVIPIADLERAYDSRYEKIYPTQSPSTPQEQIDVSKTPSLTRSISTYNGDAIDTPIVCLPIFPGSNCDYDTAKAFRKAGAVVRPFVFRNCTEKDVLASIDELANQINECQILAFCGGFSCGDEPDGSGKFIANVICNELISKSIQALQQRGGLILGICNGFQALVKSGLLPYGEIGAVNTDSPTLFRNNINRHISQITETEVVSVNSPWLSSFHSGDRHAIAISHGEGRFVINQELGRQLVAAGQVAFRYVENPNGSSFDIEGITSPNGLILGKMGHSERYEENLLKNITGNRQQTLFENAVNYFRKKQLIDNQ